MKKLNDQDVVDLIKKLIEIPSVSSNESDVADFLEIEMEQVFGQNVRRDGNSTIIELGDKNAKNRLLLCSHIDTVSPADGWTYNPYKATEEQNRIYGLGANDALASVVCMVGAVSNLKDKIKDTGITIVLAEEEEMGSNGFYRIEKNINYTSAIFGEPTEMKAATQMRGYMRVKLIGQGKACHASRPWEGKNAIFDLVQQLTKIEQQNLKDDSPWGQATIEPTIIKGGTSTNQIADYADAILDIRPTAAVNNEKIIEILDNVECRYEIIHNRRRPMQCDESSQVMQAVNDALPNQEKFAFGGTCDMAFASKPAIVMGVGKSVRSHAADEFIELAELKDGKAKYEKIVESFIKLF